MHRIFSNIFHIWKEHILCGVIKVLRWFRTHSTLYMRRHVISCLLIWIASTPISLSSYLIFIQEKCSRLSVRTLIIIWKSTHRFVLVFLRKEIRHILSRCHGPLFPNTNSKICFTLLLILCVILFICNLPGRILQIHLHHTLGKSSIFKLLNVVHMRLLCHKVALVIILSIQSSRHF